MLGLAAVLTILHHFFDFPMQNVDFPTHGVDFPTAC